MNKLKTIAAVLASSLLLACQVAQQRSEPVDSLGYTHDYNDNEFVEASPQPTPMVLGRVGIDSQASTMDKIPLPSTSASVKPRKPGEMYTQVANPQADGQQPTRMQPQGASHADVNKYGNPVRR